MGSSLRHLCALALLLAVSLVSGPYAQQTPPGSNHVVIISLDGFPGWAFEDPLVPVPTLRRLAAAGAVSTGMRPVNPTVTWPNHTSMVAGVGPARHGVTFNGLLTREPGVPPRIEPWVDRDRMVHAKTLYDAVHERGMTTAQVDWVAIQNAPTITWEFAERPDPNGPIARELVQAGLVSREDVEEFGSRNILWRDHIWTTAAAHIVRQHRPNLLLFHLLNLDSTHHRYGPRTPAGMTAMAHLDSQVAALLEAVGDAGVAERTTFFVVSDHGFKTVKRQVRPNAAFAKAGLLQVEGSSVTRADVYSVPEGGSAIVYVTVPDADGALLQRARQALAGIEGIGAIVEPADFARYGLAQPAPGGQMGALFLTAAEGYAFTAAVGEDVVIDTPATSLGAHGYVASDPEIRALFIASGRGIRPGVTLPVMSTLDLAPTAARLLGVALPSVDGRVLDEILDPTR